MFFSGSMPSQRTEGSCGSSIFSFLRALHALLLSGCAKLHSHQEWIGEQSRRPYEVPNTCMSFRSYRHTHRQAHTCTLRHTVHARALPRTHARVLLSFPNEEEEADLRSPDSPLTPPTSHPWIFLIILTSMRLSQDSKCNSK